MLESIRISQSNPAEMIRELALSIDLHSLSDGDFFEFEGFTPLGDSVEIDLYVNEAKRGFSASVVRIEYIHEDGQDNYSEMRGEVEKILNNNL
jgi:hypothetical protein